MFRWLFISISFILLLLSYNNCAGENAQFAQEEFALQASDTEPSVFAICSGPRVFETITIRIDENRDGCPYGRNGDNPDTFGNLSRKNQWIRARYEQEIVLNELQGRTLCSMEIKSQTSTNEEFCYDDLFILTLNDYILSSGANVSLFEEIRQDNLPPLYVYNWLDLRDTSLEGSPGGSYCLETTYSNIPLQNNELGCHWSPPITEGMSCGELQLYTPKEAIQTITNQIPEDEGFVLKLIVTGDNDLTDCNNSAISLDLKVSYPAE